MANSRIEELKARVQSAKDAAAAKALTDDEKEEASLLQQETEALESAAAADAARRHASLKAREAAAQAKAVAGKYLVAGIDLVSLFAFGKSPPAEHLPAGGVIIVRNPTAEATDALNLAVEAKQLSVAKIMANLLCACVVDPDPSSTDGVTLRGFCDTYPDAATQAAQRARELGGAKAQADKRGRT